MDDDSSFDNDREGGGQKAESPAKLFPPAGRLGGRNSLAAKKPRFNDSDDSSSCGSDSSGRM